MFKEDACILHTTSLVTKSSLVASMLSSTIFFLQNTVYIACLCQCFHRRAIFRFFSRKKFEMWSPCGFYHYFATIFGIVLCNSSLHVLTDKIIFYSSILQFCFRFSENFEYLQLHLDIIQYYKNFNNI